MTTPGKNEADRIDKRLGALLLNRVERTAVSSCNAATHSWYGHPMQCVEELEARVRWR